jgi:hypothetical protein
MTNWSQEIMNHALELNHPIAFATRAHHLARRVAEVGRAKWTTDAGTLVDPAEVEPLLQAYSSLQIAATDEYLNESEWEGVQGAPSRLQTLTFLRDCFKHAQWQIETTLIASKPAAVLVDVNGELQVLIAQLEEACKEA